MNVTQKQKNLTGMLLGALGLSDPVCLYDISIMLRETFPDLFIFETEDWDFDLEEYGRRGHADLRTSPFTHPLRRAEWMGVEKGIEWKPQIVLTEVSWQGHELLVLSSEYDNAGSRRRWILAEDEALANRFFGEVCRTLAELTDEILVWEYGCCRRDPDLYEAIRTASIDSLVLPGRSKEDLMQDVETFFASEALYQRYGLAWRRGLILVGPPGNGKTHAIKALVQHARRPCLYVRSFQSRTGPQSGVRGAFHQARRMAPCLMVMEDVESLVDAKTRSFFLNELDGFAQNRGIVVLATSNYPEKLDPAIADRPSRFDRKIAFGLPETAERRRYLASLTARWEDELRLSEPELATVAELTDGFSYAYLKELATSGLFAWMRERQPGSMARVILDLVGTLRHQMANEPPPTTEESEDDDD